MAQDLPDQKLNDMLKTYAASKNRATIDSSNRCTNMTILSQILELSSVLDYTSMSESGRLSAARRLPDYLWELRGVLSCKCLCTPTEWANPDHLRHFLCISMQIQRQSKFFERVMEHWIRCDWAISLVKVKWGRVALPARQFPSPVASSLVCASLAWNVMCKGGGKGPVIDTVVWTALQVAGFVDVEDGFHTQVI
jgi:hypothetical protein